MRLWDALERRPDVEVLDVPIELPRLIDSIGRISSLRLVHGRTMSTWAMRPWYARLAQQALSAAEGKVQPPDAILSIGEHGSTVHPLYIYQDHCYGHGLEMYHETGEMPHGWSGVALSDLQHRAEMQARTYASCAGVFTMSQWNADFLVRSGLVPASNVHAIHAGINVPVVLPTEEHLHQKRARDERTILFVGREFHRKGGDLVLAAFERAKQISARPLRLIVAGPKKWPVTGAIPERVEFVGDEPFLALREHMRTADVMVMPSRFEAFGIVFIESLAAGTPVIGRRSFAMPEMITHGHNGMMIDTDDVEALAQMIVDVVESETIARTCHNEARSVSEYYSWDRVASDIMSIIGHGSKE
ncbi:MAG: glycosyltransferase family 4 protein, partial [Candidatus Kapabacteria bacterium]|nr:glycosyltransferase family 4 protein [Candidatus Kapabacteria bacterium]